MDKSSSEFTEWILNGLLPQFKWEYAKRISTFPAFRNIRQYFKSYNYTDEDWNTIANMVYDLGYNFQKEPKKLEEHIKKFTANKKLQRRLQVGSITPIFFCVNDKYPVINNRIKRTYKDFASINNWKDEIDPKIESYLDGIKKCQKLIDFLEIDELKDLGVFDVFCYWYDHIL